MKTNILFPILNKHSLHKQEILKIGEKILDNKLIVKYNYIPTNIDSYDIRLDYTNKEFNWELDFDTHTNMAMLHLHSLEPISYLLLAYSESNQLVFLEKAYELLIDWFDHAKCSEHFYLWYRHCVADRAIVISQLYLLKNHIDLTKYQKDVIYSLIFSHRNYLLQNENYVHHNHGLLMDMGLLSLSIVTHDDATFEYSYERIKSNFMNTFTDNMICVENSISYSVYNIEQFIKCQKYLLEPLEFSIDNQFDCKIEQALDFLNEIKQPDNKFPNLGDGEQIDLEYLKTLDIYKYFNYHNIFMESKEKEYMKVYPNEGYAIFRNNNKYFFLTAGDVKKNHKHADDLSFTLFYDEEVFIDPGISTYNKDALREYQTSSAAHNTIVLNNENYNYINNKKDDVNIIYFKEFDSYYYVIMQNNSYSYANILRHIFILKSDFSIVLHDEVSSRSKILASQFFNLSAKFSNNLSFSMENSKVILNDRIFIQTEKSSFFEFQNGRNPYNINAISSTKFHDIQPIFKLSINTFNKDPQLTTFISNSKENHLEITSDFRSTDLLKVLTKNGLINLYKNKLNPNLLSTSEPHIIIEREGNKIKCETISSFYENQEYAWDIMKGQEKEELIWYQESNIFEYTFSNSGTYSIRCYIRNKEENNQKKSFVSEQKVIV